MADRRSSRRRRRRRGVKTKTRRISVSTIILIIALIVFVISAVQLIRIVKGYLDGEGEYDDVRDLAITTDGEDKFTVDFDALLAINPDTIGWIRFYPEPKEISYPVVQGRDNDYYLHNTFSDNENTLGAIFLNYTNKSDFTDRNSIVYGHRMRDGSMFRHLEDYEDESFWKDNPYFYIYTVGGRELKYEIYSAGVVKDTSDTYLTEFADDAAFQSFIDYTKSAAAYDTGVDVTTSDKIVTLSTCTSASNEDRFVVRGVLIQDKPMGE